MSRLSRPRAVACSRGLSSPRVALVPCDAANVGRAVGDRRLQSVRVGSRAGVRLGEENERVESSGARRNLRSTPIHRGLRGRRLDGRAPDAEKLFWARNPSVKPANELGLTSRPPRPKLIRADVTTLPAAREPETSRDPPENAKRQKYDHRNETPWPTPHVPLARCDFRAARAWSRRPVRMRRLSRESRGDGVAVM